MGKIRCFRHRLIENADVFARINLFYFLFCFIFSRAVILLMFRSSGPGQEEEDESRDVRKRKC